MIGEDRRPRIESIPIGRIVPPPRPFRRPALPAEVERLAASIRTHGLLHPLIVRPAGRNTFEVVCGHRRLQACKSLGMGEVPAVVRVLDDRQALELSVAENARRDPLSAEERAEALRRLRDLYPGRAPADLEAWLGPVALPEPQAALAPAPDSKILFPPEEPGGEEAAEGKKDKPSRLVPRVRMLLETLSTVGELDVYLLRKVVDELLERLDGLPAPDFLNLAYEEPPEQCLPRHCVNVAKLAMYLGRSRGLPRPEIEDLAICGLLHDVGMMQVQDAVFAKNAALDEVEWRQVKGHPTEGAILLEKEALLRDVIMRVIAEHHERPDGSGYPAGKKRDEIHLYARVINIVDTYEALVSPRAHRLPLLPFQAMQVVIDDGAKGMLDWDLVQSFVGALSVYPLGSYVRLEGGEIARVVRANPAIPEKPVIAIVADASRNVLSDPVEIDLAMAEPPRFEPIASPL